MNSLLTLQLNQSRVDDDQIVHIVQEYPKEYGISIQLGQMFKDAFDIELPIEEIVIIAMFLIKDEEDTEGHPYFYISSMEKVLPLHYVMSQIL